MEEIKNDLHWLMFWCFFSGFTMCLGIWMLWKPKKKKRKSKFPKCDCKDVNQCSKWCHAKHLFKKDSDNGLI